MSSEYIFEINDALYDHETGRVCMMPKIVGALIRCKDCKYKNSDIYKNAYICDRFNGNVFVVNDDFCSYAEGRNDED